MQGEKQTKMVTRHLLQQSTWAWKLNWAQNLRWVSLIKHLSFSRWILLARHATFISLFAIKNFYFSLIRPYRDALYLQVPVLETPDGPIFESNAIARYGMITYTYVHHFLYLKDCVNIVFLLLVQLLAWRLTIHCMDPVQLIV